MGLCQWGQRENWRGNKLRAGLCWAGNKWSPLVDFLRPRVGRLQRGLRDNRTGGKQKQSFYWGKGRVLRDDPPRATKSLPEKLLILSLTLPVVYVFPSCSRT